MATTEQDDQTEESASLGATCYPSAYTLDNFICQDLSKLTGCGAPELASRFPQSSYWIGNFILNSMFGRPIGHEPRKFCLAFLRRAEAAFFNYELAREALLDFETSIQQGPRKNSLYFKALHFFEVSLSMQWQAFDLFRKLSKTEPFKKGDGTSTEKLNRIHNASKHTDPASLPAGLLHAVWITNDGLNTHDVCLTFAELKDLMEELGHTADYASSVSFYGKGNAAPSEDSNRPTI